VSVFFFKYGNIEIGDNVFTELSEVLWTKVLKMGFNLLPGYGAAISIYLIFAFWATLTLAILVMMEGLSAFLHTLRLHWYKISSWSFECGVRSAYYFTGWNL
jgi:vacuolar-type H+-ATPase subunit I/STV1